MKTKSNFTFIQNPTPSRLERAAASNHMEWMTGFAQIGGGEVHQENGATWTWTPAPKSGGVIAFPEWSDEGAGEQLDAIVRYYRQRRSETLIGCWSLYPFQPADLGIRLLARGFQLGWKPHWMWLDFQKMRPNHPRPEGLRVESVEDDLVWGVENLPYYYDDEGREHLHAALRLHPRRMRYFAAWLGGKPVGHCTVFLTTGDVGVAGIYSCGVVPECRGKGIGKAVTLAACQYAQAEGCPGAMLNATGMGEPMYRNIGFESVGYGRTWWLNVERLESRPPTQRQIAIAEAVGRGDVSELDSLNGQMKPGELDITIPCGMTLIELAVHADKPKSAEWLVEHGVTPDIISAWSFGWKDQVRQLLAESPELATWCSAENQMTPLHVAAAHNDMELARLLLAAHPDLSTQGSEHGTALHEAAWGGHSEMVELLLMHNPPLTAVNQYGGTPLSSTVYASVNSPNRDSGDFAGVVEALIVAGSPMPEKVSGSEAVTEVLRRYGVKE